MPMKAILIILLMVALFTAFLFFRHLRIQLGFKDSNYGRVQHTQRLPKTKEKQETFLPGSRADLPDAVDEIAKAMEEGLEVFQFKKKKKNKGNPLGSKLDMKRAYIIDAILERPKF